MRVFCAKCLDAEDMVELVDSRCPKCNAMYVIPEIFSTPITVNLKEPKERWYRGFCIDKIGKYYEYELDAGVTGIAETVHEAKTDIDNHLMQKGVLT
jgi:hypothetical protein